jgi:SAM-dependent methyltransferase
MSETTGGGKVASRCPSSLTRLPEEIELPVVTGSSPGLANRAGVRAPGFAAPLSPGADTRGELEEPVASWAVARGPTRALAARRYRDVAPGYDAWTAAWQAYRQRAVETLAPAAGSVVLDVGCGTGLNFAGLEQAIGPRGRLIGIDLSPDMLARAYERVQSHGWQNVTLLQAAGQDVALPVEADAALFSAVHDILRAPVALANVLSHYRSGGRVVAAGPKWVPWWRPASLALNSCAWLINRNCVTTFEGFDAPWSHLDRLLPDLAVEEVFFGAGFIAMGTRPAASPAA